jgi:hypothetical protein
MKQLLVISTVAILAAGSVTVSAYSGVTLRGSDTLFDFTTQMLNSCPGTSTNSTPAGASQYQGGASDIGQSNLVAGVQQVAPMSRFLNGGAMCTTVRLADGGTVPWGTTTLSDGGVIPNLAAAQGLVIGLDAVQIIGSKSTLFNAGGGATACNQSDNANCSPTARPGTAAMDTNIAGAGYKLRDWRDVLRILLAGYDQLHCGDYSGRDCNSLVRQTLANNYGAFFENNCAAAHGDATTGAGVCASIRHIFRRDDFSGTTDTLVSLLDLPSIIYPETTSTGGLVPGGKFPVTQNHTGASPFCNAVRPAYVFPAGLMPTALQGSDATWDPTSTNTVPGSATTAPVNGVTQRETAVYRATMQDNDPIRRTCFGSGAGTAASEDVCSHSGDLGLVLVMNDVPEETLSSPRTNADRYNPNPCVKNRLVSVTAPDAYDAITQTKQICTRGLLCPNGDKCNQLGGCVAPADANSNVQCLASKLTAPTLTISTTAVPAVHPVGPGVAEGRAYNQHLYVQLGSAGAYQLNGFSTPFPVTGAFYRIHAVHSLSTIPNPITGANRTCQLRDMDDQIGCLVEASPCSLGYAGRRSTANVANNNLASQPINLNNQSPDVLCIQGDPTQNPPIAGFTYPLSRKLYLNTIQGFANVTGDELQLAGCETDLAQSGPIPTPAGLLTTNPFSGVTTFGFVTLAPTVNSGEPYCEDFNEQALCGRPSNANGCPSATPSNFTNFPAVNTTCGNGVIDPYEECDQGTLNGPPPRPCSLACRLNVTWVPTVCPIVYYSSPDAGTGDADAGDAGPPTTSSLLSAQGPNCLSCAESHSCLAAAGDGNACELLTGTAQSGDMPESMVCTHTLQAIFSSHCAASGQLMACLCGSGSTDFTACETGQVTPSGAAYPDYLDDVGLDAGVSGILANFTNSATGSGLANNIVQCLASSGCACNL